MVLVPVLIIAVFYFLYHFITMNSTPFKAMQAIYVYIAALIGLALVATGLYAIVEMLLGILLTYGKFDQAELVTPLTQLIIGLFIMVPHWAIGHHFHLKEHKK